MFTKENSHEVVHIKTLQKWKQKKLQKLH